MKYAKGWAWPDADEFMVGQLQPDGRYQGAHLDQALAYVTDWTCALDGGAHVGTWARVLSGRFDRVVAVEPSPDTFEALTANMQTFGCLNVECRQAALGAAAGTVSMTLDAANTARANTGGRFVQPKGPIPLQTIDSFALPTLGFIKLDVEGSEVAALLGATQTLQRCRPIVLFENKKLWTRYGQLPDAPQRLLTRFGYRERERAGCDAIWGPA